jgi:pimeloyl-ACP methyl ester carboxylesterase
MNRTEHAIPAGADARLGGTLAIPARARGIVVFAHGSGSGRFSARNTAVARVLNDARFGTLLMDLLTESEEEAERFTRHLRFDIGLLADRLVRAIDWVGAQEELPVGAFGASTGAAAALVAAAERPHVVRTVVSRGGRPDLAGGALASVRAPTLLIVGGADPVVLELNREAQAAMTGTTDLRIVPGASHLFEEPGALEEVAALARGWFARYLEDHAA